MAFHLVIDIKQLIQGIKQHLGPIALVQNVLVPQSAVLHGGHLEACNAIRLVLPVLLHPPLEYGFKPTDDNQQNINTGIKVSHDP